MNNFDGWINLYKPLKLSSFQVLKIIKKKFNVSKIGHAGTLDPLAEGILPIAVGSATKMIAFIQDTKKEYEFAIKWGEQTSTDDREGKIISISNFIPNCDQINKKIKKYKGLIKQKPPKASAVKINGIRAYNLLRTNKKFETNERIVEIFDAKHLHQIKNNISLFKIECGKGFYIRSFARDLGDDLNTKAHVYSLKRTKVGKFNLNNAILLDDLLKIRQMALGNRGFHSTVSVLDDILAIEINDEKIIRDISHGKFINFKNLPEDLKTIDNKLYFISNKNKIISIGFFEGSLFKPKKVFIKEI